MDFSTKISIPKSSLKIDYTTNVAFIGSCFAENISNKYTERKFHTFVNPLGIIYNPLSIENIIKKIEESSSHSKFSHMSYTENNVFFDGESWCCWDAHGLLSVKGKNNREICVNGLNNAIIKSKTFLKQAHFIFITLGTANIFFLRENGSAIANCHKQHANLFERRMISVSETTTALLNIISALKNINPNLQIVFTVSPLRHMNDGLHTNNLSKATLLLAVEKVCQQFSDQVSYFPSYEIVMDELRDYRFYADDMIHLSKIAENYIFEKMCETYCNDKTIDEMKRVENFMKTVNHRIINADSTKTIMMAKQQIKHAEELEKQINGLDLSLEKKYFQECSLYDYSIEK